MKGNGLEEEKRKIKCMGREVSKSSQPILKIKTGPGKNSSALWKTKAKWQKKNTLGSLLSY